MLLVRILGLVVGVGLGGRLLRYALSSERRYLRYAWQVFSYALFLLVLVPPLLFGEHLLAVV